MSKRCQRKNWIVLSGLVRDPKLLLEKLDILCQWRNQGIVEGIVFSTWIGEIEQYEGLRHQIKERGIKLVETLEPVLRAIGHVLHQMKAIYYGLEICPDDVYVMRMRSDLANPTESISQVLSGNLDLTIDDSDGWPKIFEERIRINNGFVTAPFFICDLYFYGRKKDVQKLIHFDVRYEMMFCDMATEQWFHAHPFIDTFKIFTSYFQVQKGLCFGNREMAAKYLDYLMSSPFLLKVLMSYLLIISRYYRVRGTLSQEQIAKEREIIKKIPYAALFKEDTNVPGITFKVGPNALHFHQETWIHALLNKGFAEDEVGERLHQALAEVKEWSFHQNWISNSVKHYSDVLKVSQDFEKLFSHRASKIDRQPKIQDRDGYIIRGFPDRFQVLNQDKQKTYEQEIVPLRRKVQHLNQVLQQKEKEIQKLTQEAVDLRSSKKQEIIT